MSFAVDVATDVATDLAGKIRLQLAAGCQKGESGLYKKSLSTLANSRVFAGEDNDWIRTERPFREAIALPTQDELDEAAVAGEPEVKEPYQKRSLVRKRNQEVSRAAGNETVLGGDEEKGLIDGSCLPGYDNDENSKRSCDPLRDNVTVLPGRSCVVDGAENIFEAKDPFPFKPSNTSCGWSRQPQLPGLGKDENEKGQPALPTSPQGAADKDIKKGTVEQPDQQKGEQDMTGDKEELSRVEEEIQEESCLSNDEAIEGVWSMPEEGGAIINGRKYTKHALERMAPDTIEVRAKLSKRAIEKGINPNTDDFNKYVQPRGIPPMVIEGIIQSVQPIIGEDGVSLEYEGTNITVITTLQGEVFTVFQKSNKKTNRKNKLKYGNKI